MTDPEIRGIELRTMLQSDETIVLSLEDVVLGAPEADEVVVRVQAAPLNPSDLALLLGPGDLSTMVGSGTAERPRLTLSLPPGRGAALAARLGQSLPAGNEGAGVVIRAGAAAASLLGKTVAMLGGAMYTQYRRLKARDCVILPDGVAAQEGASMFVNPLTSLAMVETMRLEGHTALVHTAAASNLGQMLNRICLADGIALVNIVRSQGQADLLRSLGAPIVLDSATPDFVAALADAVARTGATIAFDAIGGGTMANSILHAMEAAASRNATAYSRYGSSVHKQVYIYGMLDTGPTFLDRGFGFSWSVSGFLLTPFLARLGREGIERLRGRVLRDLKTTFASHYTHTISLAEALGPTVVLEYAKKATGRKYLIDPSRD